MDEPKTVISVNGGSGVPNASAQCVINVQLATSSVTSAARDRWVARGTAMLSLVEAVVALSWLFGQRVRLPSMKALCATPTLWCAAGSCRVSKPSSYRPTAPSSKHALSGHCCCAWCRVVAGGIVCPHHCSALPYGIKVGIHYYRNGLVH